MFSVWMVVALAVGVCARDRYLLYTVNPGEGFNLGRDVYLRVGALMNKLTTDTADHWTLVLPPWTNPHWREGDRDSNWSKFFDLSSLRKAVNCIELDDYIALKGTGAIIDEVMHLQHPYRAPGQEWKWVPQVTPEECNFGTYPGTQYEKGADGMWHGRFWGRGNRIWAKKLSCYGTMGEAYQIFDNIVKSEAESVCIARFETLTHTDSYGFDYWRLRSSMRFAVDLYKEATKFQKKYLGSDFMAAHLRRSDFLYARAQDIASIEDVTEQLESFMAKLGVSKVFLSTDARADDEEFKTLAHKGIEFVRYPGGPGLMNDLSRAKFSEGQRAIIDQILCARAPGFIGTKDSTFTYRIHEERDILNKPIATTYNTFCKKSVGEDGTLGFHCETPSKWTREEVLRPRQEL
eukprot:m.432655 g.432655  ORF g.432655 m.432655 type:complete len:405 (+) comp56752_c0_seq3:71-1285(+)